MRRRSEKTIQIFDRFLPYYSPEKKGDLKDYLYFCNDSGIDNSFFGSEYFTQIIDLGLIRPGVTTVRVNFSPAPDQLYFINQENLLESNGQGEYNMSAVAAPKGIYKPEDILTSRSWSISGLNFSDSNRL